MCARAREGAVGHHLPNTRDGDRGAVASPTSEIHQGLSIVAGATQGFGNAKKWLCVRKINPGAE